VVPQGEHCDFEGWCGSREIGFAGAHLLSTSTNSAHQHLMWELPKGERL
jgi:hypothetical protein